MISSLFFFLDNAPEVAKPKGRAGPKKAPTRKVSNYRLFYNRGVSLRDFIPICSSAASNFLSCYYSTARQVKSLLRDEDDDDDDEVLELKDRLAAYNLESSPDQSEGNCLYLFH